MSRYVPARAVTRRGLKETLVTVAATLVLGALAIVFGGDPAAEEPLAPPAIEKAERCPKAAADAAQATTTPCA